MTFSWMAFDTNFIMEVIMASDMSDEFKQSAKESLDDKDVLVSKMNRICPYPDREFISKFRPIIEQNLLKFYKTEVNNICKALNIHAISHNDKQIKMTKKPFSASLIQAYICALYNISGLDTQFNEYSKFSSTISLNMKETAIEDVPLYDFQEEAVDKLKEHFITNSQSSGLLVMPTGSGKSRTATSFLIKEMISQGYQILWIAHRHTLIDQAADCFYRFAGLSKINNSTIKDYRISCISGQHLNIKFVDKHEVIVASISSICRNKAHLRRILGNKVMVVVDECHHTFAPTYRDTIEFIKKCKNDTKLLGLTATPIRANEKDSKQLLGLFDGNIVYDVSMADLIAKGILAQPIFTHIETNENFEPEITIDEEKLIQKYGELPETLVTKIAMSSTRNSLIIEEYMNNKDKYGKTLIFAMNILHCRLLHEELEAKGIKCGLVYSGKDDNSRVINQFKDGKLDVLINVNIMTEGTDVPDIQTIFLTRPTSSEGLLMQMIGRGMRGVQANGTETVNIIDFHDQWDTFNRWLNPEWLIAAESLDAIPEPSHHVKTEYEYYDWAMCLEIYKSMNVKATKFDVKYSIPAGWYTLIDEDGEEHRMLVFEDQIKGIKAMMADKENWKDDLSITPLQIIRRYFNYFCCNPPVSELELLIDNVRNLEDCPTIRTFVDRKKIEPYFVVKHLEETGEDIFNYSSKIFDENETVRDLYKDKETYQMELCKTKIYKERTQPIGIKVEELPDELIPFDRTPVYEIDELVKEVNDSMFGGNLEGLSDITWTDKAYRQYFGIHYHIDNSIKINCVLNSKDVPREVVKFVIYHEMLHINNWSHDAAFRAEERKYPQYEEWEHFLAYNINKSDIFDW